ncbi:MAG: CTP synthetase [Rhizobiales bacterium]|jgi:predicted PurR-regulated permease PerM|nr:CTP synthetase [Hyphomicrobiales bacterium]
MLRLSLMLFAIIATTLMGTGVVAVLTMQFNSTALPIIAAAAAGFVLAIPVSWLVAKQLMPARR